MLVYGGKIQFRENKSQPGSLLADADNFRLSCGQSKESSGQSLHQNKNLLKEKLNAMISKISKCALKKSLIGRDPFIPQALIEPHHKHNEECKDGCRESFPQWALGLNEVG